MQTNDSKFYTHATWKLKQGNEEQFRKTWLKLKDLSNRIGNPPIYAKLIKNSQDPLLLYSFAAWNRMEDMEKMRDNTEGRNIFQELSGLCTESIPMGAYLVVEEINVGQKEYADKGR